MEASMKLLVTGGAGFIGSNFIRHMLNKYPSYHIVNIDSLTYAGNRDNLQDLENNLRYSFVRGDITCPETIDKLMDQSIDLIVNFAAESHVDRSILQPELFVRTNVLGTHNLLRSAVRYGVHKFIQISTDEVYGSLGDSGLFTEETSLQPNSPYSATKAGGDFLVRAYHETYGLKINITRCSNNYGPFQFPEKLIPLVVANALRNETIPIYGDGMNVRDWLYVEDHCRAIDLVIHKGSDGEIYNIGGNNERTNIQIVEMILSLLNKPNSLISFVKDRAGHDRRYAIDSTKIRDSIGWKPLYSLQDGIKKTLQWYIDNQKWLSHVQTSTE